MKTANENSKTKNNDYTSIRVKGDTKNNVNKFLDKSLTTISTLLFNIFNYELIS
mgnify:CR=1 FL=1